MDQIKIGKFIAERRRSVNLTQMQLAEMLGITDRAVSKWECGKALPDVAIMLKLCGILKISVNDLLCGEVVSMDNYNEKLESNLIKLVKEKEESDKRLLKIETVMGICCILPFLAATVLALTVTMAEWITTLMVLGSLLPLLIALPFLIKIEQKAGYYECAKCGHKHIPKYSSVFFSMHLNRTRYMRCPECNKRSWQKKRISKDGE